MIQVLHSRQIELVMGSDVARYEVTNPMMRLKIFKEKCLTRIELEKV
jgi:hypothetical protein